ncbi:MAG: diversity-generating retroelement protein Avd [Hormoscilla sp. GM102CHS1]|nr:diversity-generating retroelement protein Avd [Hormoscilla sp. GM102CHS1]
MSELPIIQKTYDLIKWYVPILNRLPRDHKFILGDRITTGIYDLLDKLIIARYVKEKLDILEGLNGKLDILRYQTRLLVDIGLMKLERYEYVSKVIDEIGKELGGWLKHLRQRHKYPQITEFANIWSAAKKAERGKRF